MALKRLLIPQMSILFVVLLGSFTVNAAENLYFDPAETQYFKELPKPSEVKPPLPRGGSIQPPSVMILKSSQMRSPGARTRIPIIQEQIERLGYQEVSDDDVSPISLDNVKNQFIPMEEITKNISSPISIISTGVYKTMTLAGAIASGAAKKTGKWTHVSRYFSLENGDVLVLVESDYKAGEYSVIIPEELVNETVNGSPASMVTKKTRAGKFLTELSWFTENKMYTLHLSRRSVGVGIKNELIVFATGVVEPVAK